MTEHDTETVNMPLPHFEVERVKDLLKGQYLVRSVDVVPRGYARIGTTLLYLDGTSVDLFIVAQNSLEAPYKLTDLGETTRWVLDMQFKSWRSKKYQRLVENALELHGVTRSGGAFERPLASLDELVHNLIRLGQACIRVADLTYACR